MFSHALSLFLWIVLYNFTQQAMEFQKEVYGWLDEATLFPAKEQVSHHHDLNFSELTTFPEDEKAKDRDVPFFDIPNVSDILDNWMDEKIDLSILDSTFQDILSPPSSSLKPDVLDVATEIDTLVDSYFQSSVFLPFETADLPSFKFKPPIEDDIPSSPSTSTNFLIPEAAASSPVSILPEVGLQLPCSPVESTWSVPSSPVGRCVPSSPMGRSVPSSPVGTPLHSESNLSDVSEETDTSGREIDSPAFTACYVEIVECDSQPAPTTEILKKRASSSISKALKVNAQPYSVAPYQLKKESRRERKKVQNKEAAARYRTKKREQDKVLGGEVAELEDEQKALKDKHDSLKTEIKYLKSLMREMFKARGLLK